MRIKIYTISFVLAVFMAFPAGVRAQTQSHNAMGGSHITVTGCLQNGTDPDTYTLNNANNVMNRTTEMSRNQSTSTPSEMPRTENSSYVLVPGKVSLRGFVGQRVRVTGNLSGEQSMNNPASSSAGKTSQSDESSSSSSMSGHHRLMVTSIHKISGTCP